MSLSLQSACAFPFESKKAMTLSLSKVLKSLKALEGPIHSLYIPSVLRLALDACRVPP